jgi:hypothetical protein
MAKCKDCGADYSMPDRCVGCGGHLVAANADPRDATIASLRAQLEEAVAKVRTWSAACLAATKERDEARAKALEEALSAVSYEEELPGEMPIGMEETIRLVGLVVTMRTVVVQTKLGIYNRIRALLPKIEATIPKLTKEEAGALVKGMRADVDLDARLRQTFTVPDGIMRLGQSVLNPASVERVEWDKLRCDSCGHEPTYNCSSVTSDGGSCIVHKCHGRYRRKP